MTVNRPSNKPPSIWRVEDVPAGVRATLTLGRRELTVEETFNSGVVAMAEVCVLERYDGQAKSLMWRVE